VVHESLLMCVSRGRKDGHRVILQQTVQSLKKEGDHNDEHQPPTGSSYCSASLGGDAHQVRRVVGAATLPAGLGQGGVKSGDWPGMSIGGDQILRRASWNLSSWSGWA
jgi:hypothetical protein